MTCIQDVVPGLLSQTNDIPSHTHNSRWGRSPGDAHVRIGAEGDALTEIDHVGTCPRGDAPSSRFGRRRPRGSWRRRAAPRCWGTAPAAAPMRSDPTASGHPSSRVSNFVSDLLGPCPSSRPPSKVRTPPLIPLLRNPPALRPAWGRIASQPH